MKYLPILLISLLLLSACAKTEKTGQAINIEKEKIKEQFEVEEPEFEPIDISQDPKKQEALDFVTDFIISLSFPKVEGFPATPDRNSFQLVGFIIDREIYTTITQFRLRTMAGPYNKQFTIRLKDLGNSEYEILEVVEDK
jgi:hypothetical protein